MPFQAVLGTKSYRVLPHNNSPCFGTLLDIHMNDMLLNGTGLEDFTYQNSEILERNFHHLNRTSFNGITVSNLYNVSQQASNCIT